MTALHTSICPACGEKVSPSEGAYITATEDERLYCYGPCVETCDQCGINDTLDNLIEAFSVQQDGEYHRYHCTQCQQERTP